MFTLKIKTAGSAFEDPFFDGDDFFRQREIARILRETAEKLDLYAEMGKNLEYSALMDINGNKCGELKFTK